MWGKIALAVAGLIQFFIAKYRERELRDKINAEQEKDNNVRIQEADKIRANSDLDYDRLLRKIRESAASDSSLPNIPKANPEIAGGSGGKIESAVDGNPNKSTQPNMGQKLFIKPTRPISRIFLHCSASDRPQDDDVEVIRKWHMSPSKTDPSKPWKDIGYHFYINKAGKISKGRNVEMTPAAQVGNNFGTIAICMGGLKNFTAAQEQALIDICDVINYSYNGKVTFHGHCEVSNKTCPVYDYRHILGLDDEGFMPL